MTRGGHYSRDSVVFDVLAHKETLARLDNRREQISSYLGGLLSAGRQNVSRRCASLGLGLLRQSRLCHHYTRYKGENDQQNNRKSLRTGNDIEAVRSVCLTGQTSPLLQRRSGCR